MDCELTPTRADMVIKLTDEDIANLSSDGVLQTEASINDVDIDVIISTKED